MNKMKYVIAIAGACLALPSAGSAAVFHQRLLDRSLLRRQRELVSGHFGGEVADSDLPGAFCGMPFYDPVFVTYAIQE